LPNRLLIPFNLFSWAYIKGNLLETTTQSETWSVGLRLKT